MVHDFFSTLSLDRYTVRAAYFNATGSHVVKKESRGEKKKEETWEWEKRDRTRLKTQEMKGCRGKKDVHVNLIGSRAAPKLPLRYNSHHHLVLK